MLLGVSPFSLTWHDSKNVPLFFNPSPADGYAVRKPASCGRGYYLSLKGDYHGIY